MLLGKFTSMSCPSHMGVFIGSLTIAPQLETSTLLPLKNLAALGCQILIGQLTLDRSPLLCSCRQNIPIARWLAYSLPPYTCVKHLHSCHGTRYRDRGGILTISTNITVSLTAITGTCRVILPLTTTNRHFVGPIAHLECQGPIVLLIFTGTGDNIVDRLRDKRLHHRKVIGHD